MTRTRSSRPSITVEIAGETHVLRSDAPADYTRSVAAHLDATIQQLQQSAPLEPHRAAILAALFITDELFRAREEIAELRTLWRNSSAAVAQSLEEAIGEAAAHSAAATTAEAATPAE